MKAHSFALAAWALLGGCSLLDPLLDPVPAGVVTGVVLFNGQPAAGLPVTLTGAEKRAYTDAAGRYTFSGVGGGAMRVRYDSVPDRKEAAPNEVKSWVSASFSLDGGGRRVPAFDVAYNGLLYPDVGMSLIVNAKQPVPFHWSTHAQAQGYRVKVTSASGEPIWASGWAGDPTNLFAQAVPPGTYYWSVEIDGGDRGTGLTRPRQVDF